jgi:carboxymethylenebutenolidase
MVARPDDDEHYPAVLHQHGRRGLDELVQRQVRRIAARGFVVLAPDVYNTHFIEKFPIGHDYNVDSDVAKGFDLLLAREDQS